MGCTVSGAERKNYERFVWIQDKYQGNNSECFPMCGKGHKQSVFQDIKRSTDLGKSMLLRTTNSGRIFASKKMKESPRMETSSSSNEMKAHVSKQQNKELNGVDGICEPSQTKERFQAITGSYHNDCFKVPWNVTCAAEKQSAKNNNLKHISKAELGCNLQLDTGGRSACFKFYMSIFPNCNNIPTNVTTPAVSEFHSCVHNGLFVDMVKTDQVAVSVHDRFFNAFGDDCDDDDFMHPS